MSSKHLNIKISGQVHGVGFRYFSQQKAEDLDIKGFIRNEYDGSLYIEAEGEGKSLDKFLSWCKRGPDRAKVESIETSEDDFKNFSDFRIEY